MEQIHMGDCGGQGGEGAPSQGGPVEPPSPVHGYGPGSPAGVPGRLEAPSVPLAGGRAGGEVWLGRGEPSSGPTPAPDVPILGRLHAERIRDLLQGRV